MKVPAAGQPRTRRQNVAWRRKPQAAGAGDPPPEFLGVKPRRGDTGGEADERGCFGFRSCRVLWCATVSPLAGLRNENAGKRDVGENARVLGLTPSGYVRLPRWGSGPATDVARNKTDGSARTREHCFFNSPGSPSRNRAKPFSVSRRRVRSCSEARSRRPSLGAGCGYSG